MELVIVVLTLAILAGIAVPRLLDYAYRARGEAVVAQVLQIFQAAELFKATNGRWPDNADAGDFPADFEGILPKRLFTQPAPIGEFYDWNGPGTGMPSYGVSIPTISTDDMRYLDHLADDGDLGSGWITREGYQLSFQLAPN